MNLMAQEIGRVFGEMDLTKTQAQWEKAVAQAGSMEERMELFLDSWNRAAISGGEHRATSEELVTDDEIDRMIQADVLAQREGGARQARRAGKRDRQGTGGDEAEGLKSMPIANCECGLAVQTAGEIPPFSHNHSLPA